MKTIRFWDYVNGPVRLALRDGQQLRHCEGGPTDEGYSWTAITWRIEEGFLVAESYTTARDCDGPIERRATVRAKLDELTAGRRDDDDGSIAYPKWEATGSSQRDHYAEAAGY